MLSVLLLYTYTVEFSNIKNVRWLSFLTGNLPATCPLGEIISKEYTTGALDHILAVSQFKPGSILSSAPIGLMP